MLNRSSRRESDKLKTLTNLERSKLMLKYVIYLYFIITLPILLFFFFNKAIKISIAPDFMILFSFFYIGVISLLFLITSVFKHHISLFIIHWFFTLIFFSIVPLNLYIGNLYFYPVNPDEILLGNFLIILWCITYWLAWKFGQKNAPMRKLINFFSVKLDDLAAIKIKFYILLIISTILTLYFISLSGLRPFYNRFLYSYFIEQLGGWSPWGLIVTYYVRPFLFWILIIFGYIFNCRYKIKPTLLVYLGLIVLLIINLIINNSINSPRFYALTIVYGLFIIFLGRRLKSPIIFISLLFIGVFFNENSRLNF
jgi:hypothetical protein